MERDFARDDADRPDAARATGAAWSPRLEALEPEEEALDPEEEELETEEGGSDSLSGRSARDPSPAEMAGAETRRRKAPHAGLRIPGRERVRSARWPAPAVLVVAGLLVLVELVAAFLEGLRIPAFDWLLARFAHDTAAVWGGEIWRLLTATCLHGAFFHLVLNVAGILVFGIQIESRIGSSRFLVAYAGSALGGAISFQALSTGGIGVGASGALTGLVAVFLILQTASIRDGALRLGPRFWIWFAILCVLLSIDPYISSTLFGGVEVADSAHFGGVFSGLALGIVLLSPRTKAGTRRRWRVALASGALASLLFVYGTFLPVFDWTWYLWRAAAAARSGDADPAWIAAQEAQARYFGGEQAALPIIDSKVRRGRFAEAWRIWEDSGIENEVILLEAGHILFDGLYAEHGYGEEVEVVLERLVELADQALEKEPENPLLLNQAAWFRALLGSDLDLALEYARRAVAAAPAPSIVNTLGWVHFVRGEYATALEHLQEAVVHFSITEQTEEEKGDSIGGFFRRALRATWSRGGTTQNDPRIASCYLYLGIALQRTGQLEDARRVAELTRRLEPGLMAHELRLLRELEERL